MLGFLFARPAPAVLRIGNPDCSLFVLDHPILHRVIPEHDACRRLARIKSVVVSILCDKVVREDHDGAVRATETNHVDAAATLPRPPCP